MQQLSLDNLANRGKELAAYHLPYSSVKRFYSLFAAHGFALKGKASRKREITDAISSLGAVNLEKDRTYTELRSACLTTNERERLLSHLTALEGLSSHLSQHNVAYAHVKLY
jgi:hypothetical protein